MLRSVDSANLFRELQHGWTLAQVAETEVSDPGASVADTLEEVWFWGNKMRPQRARFSSPYPTDVPSLSVGDTVILDGLGAFSAGRVGWHGTYLEPDGRGVWRVVARDVRII